MMDHLDEGSMQALLDGELGEREAGAAREHLTRCGVCERELDGLRSAGLRVSAALGLLDSLPASPAPGGLITMPPPSTARRGRMPRALHLPRAALLVLGFAAAASAAVPGSPVRQWLESRIEGDRVAVTADSSIAAPEALSATLASEMGIAVAPAAGRLRVVVTGAAPGLRVRAMLTDSPSGGAYTTSDADGITFRGRDGVVEVLDAAGGELRVEIPRAALAASLEIDGRTYVLKDGDQLRLITATADNLGADHHFQIEP